MRSDSTSAAGIGRCEVNERGPTGTRSRWSAPGMGCLQLRHALFLLGLPSRSARPRAGGCPALQLRVCLPCQPRSRPVNLLDWHCHCIDNAVSVATVPCEEEHDVVVGT